MSKAPERLPGPDRRRPAPALEVEVCADGHRRPQLRLRGEIDIVTVPVLEASLSGLVDGDDPGGDVVVDLADVHFIGVAGLESLCAHARRLQQHGSRLVLSSPTGLTRRVIDILGVAELLVLSPERPPPD